jgi:tetratricopeptide (TPR) repeat protein
MHNRLIKGVVCICLFVYTLTSAYAQQSPVSSLRAQLRQRVPDTARVELLRKLSMQIQAQRPDSALLFAQQGLSLAQKINYKKGEADCLDRLGVVLWKNGKYDRALSSVIGALKIREKNKDRSGQLISLNDIGIIYADQSDYRKALEYDFKAKSIAEQLHDSRNKSIILSNIGNCYIKLTKIDSALIDSALNFEMQAYEIEQSLNNKDALPNTLSILGDIHLKMGHPALALDYYRLSVASALKNNDQIELADTYNSIASLYNKPNSQDSSVYYARLALNAARAAMYPLGIYNAGNLLTQIYRGKNEHLELAYFKIAVAAKDSLFSAEKVKQMQTLSFNEAARQQEIAEEQHREAEQRIINLQLVGIAVFIPFFFLVLLLLSKSRTHRRIIDFMSGLSLLLVFEFITLFIHPFVQRISNHLPILELGILVVLAAVLVPLHHKMTHWLREKLAHIAQHHPGNESDQQPAAEVKHPPKRKTHKSYF